MRIIQKTYIGDTKKLKFCSVTIYKKISSSNNTTRIFFKGILKIKENVDYKKFYILGIQIFCKRKPVTTSKITKEVSKIFNETTVKVYQAHAVSNLHRQVFTQFKGINKEKDIVIVGTGPSLNYYKPLKNAIHIGMNRAFEFPGIKFDYYFVAHYSDITAQYIEEISNQNFVKFYGRYLHPNFRSWNIPCNIIEKPNSHKFYIDSYMPNFEEDILSFPMKNGGSIAFMALQFALWTHPKKIFLVGCDCSMEGYYNKNIKQAVWSGYKETLKSYPMLKEFAQIYYPDIEIISINPVGLKGLFKDVYTDSYISEHPEITNVEVLDYEK